MDDKIILIQKLEQYGINGKSLSWFKDYLTNRKQYIQYGSSNNNNNNSNNNNNNNKNNDSNNNNKNNDSNNDNKILYVVYHRWGGAILRPLLFILYINDLCFISQFLNPIMFADDTNLFCSNKEIKPLILKANLELGKISEWFQTNKLSLNKGKTRFTLFHRPKDRDNLPCLKNK